MARLSEMPPESHLEILRRKFLRQNRDIAKINSDQSQKIRRLENDCARLLSENLDLRGQILRLEKQVEGNSAQRIADHALEVKAKLEVQLSEFAALLGSLGVEPPSKRRSSGDRILAKPRQKMARSPPYRRRRDTAVDAEMLAEQEGRLAPIYENKTYPRATMNSEEIMALCAAAEDTTDSPDLGPPPVSRFVEEDPVKQSPVRETDEEFVPESPRQPPTLLSPPKLDYNRTIPKSPEPTKEPDESEVKQASPIKKAVPIATPTPEPANQPTRAGAKRKYGDEDGTTQSVTVRAGKENATVAEKTFPTRAGQKRRSLAEQASNKPDRKTARTPLGAKRTPLAAKSTNEDVSSPRKTIKAAPKESKKEHAQGPTDSVMTDVSDAPKPPTEIVVFPESPPPPEVVHLLESATALPSAAPSSPTPTTPDRSAPKDMLHDTPPPADISSTGETIRPSRRARPAISYAEPNLRDKMRRPSKQLFDAVTGEGKFAHRASSHKSDDLPSGPTSSSKARSEMGSSAGGSSKTITVCDTATKAQQQALLSPLAQKDAFQDTLPSTVTMERRRRPSAAGSRESLAALERPESVSREPSPTITAAPQESTQLSSRPKTTTTAANSKNSSDSKPAPLGQKQKADIYDFTASSPVPTSKAPTPTPDTSAEFHPSASSSMSSSNPRPRTTRKSSIAAAAALRHILDEEDEDDSTKHHPPPAASRSRAAHAGRKRASMLAPKKSAMVDVLDEAALDADTSGSSLEGDGASAGVGAGAGAGGRVSRRRSMML